MPHSILLLLLALVPQLPAQLAAQETAGDEVWDEERLRAVALDIQDEIEELRGLEFERPVRVELADREAFLAHAREMLEAEGGEERVEREEEVARLLGLIPGDLDLLELSTEVLVEQVGGFYDPRSETFHVMASVPADLARIVIAHEFTHALDDQHYDLDGTAEALSGDADAALAYHAVVEGSGMEMMVEWARHHLDAEALRGVMRAQAELPSDAIGRAPPLVWKPLVALYVQGRAFLRRQRRANSLGSAARIGDIDRALASPPRSTEQVIHPVKYWSAENRDEPRELRLELLDLPPSVTLEHENTLGELQAAMVTTPFEERSGLDVSLVAQLDLQFTNEAATGWGGDRYALLAADGGHLLVWSTRWDTPTDADEFAAALDGLTEGIEAEKSATPDHDPARSGVHVRRLEGDAVRVISWRGMERAAALEVAGRVVFVEG